MELQDGVDSSQVYLSIPSVCQRLPVSWETDIVLNIIQFIHASW